MQSLIKIFKLEFLQQFLSIHEPIQFFFLDFRLEKSAPFWCVAIRMLQRCISGSIYLEFNQLDLAHRFSEFQAPPHS